MVKRKPRYMCIYVPADSRWIYRALEFLVQHFEGKGIPQSRNHLVLSAIKSALKVAYSREELTHLQEKVFEGDTLDESVSPMMP